MRLEHSNKRLTSIAIACLFIISTLLSEHVSAAPEEAQVYLDDFTETGKLGLDIHTNYVAASQQPTRHQFRITPELSYGINANWEMAAYFLSVRNPGAMPMTDGVKLRAKWRPQPLSTTAPFYWAVNVEAGQLSQRFYPDRSSCSLKLIGVWKTDPWTLGMNLNVDRPLKKNPVQAATAEIDTKIEYRVSEGMQLGIENYSSLGAIRRDPNQPQSSAANYLVADFSQGKWELNVGVGRASGQTTDRTILKAIIGVPLE